MIEPHLRHYIGSDEINSIRREIDDGGNESSSDEDKDEARTKAENKNNRTANHVNRITFTRMHLVL